MPLVVAESGSDLPFPLLIFPPSICLLLDKPLGEREICLGFLKAYGWKQWLYFYTEMIFPFHFFFLTHNTSCQILHFLEVCGFLALREHMSLSSAPDGSGVKGKA